MAGPYKDASIDLGLTGADLFRLASLSAAIGLLLPAADQLRDVFSVEFYLEWFLGTLIGWTLGVLFLAMSLMSDPTVRALSGWLARLRGRPSTQNAKEQNEREPS